MAVIKVKIADRKFVATVPAPAKFVARGLFQVNSAPGGSSVDFVTGETPNGLINGSNATFLSAFDFVPASVEVFMNGQRMVLTGDYSTSGTRIITFMISPEVGDTILINYIKL